MAERFRLDRFAAEVVNSGLAHTNQFHVMIETTPRGEQSGGEDIDIVTMAAPAIARKIPFLAHAAELPGFNMRTSQAQHLGIGPAYHYPNVQQHGDVTISFYVDHQGHILHYFHSWSNQVFDFNQDKRVENDEGAYYTVGYKKDFVRDITISLFQRGLNCYSEYKLINAWPVNIGSVPLSWAEHDIMRLSVRFAFDNYSMARLDNGKLTLKNIIANPKEVLEDLTSKLRGDNDTLNKLIGQGQELTDIYNQVNSTANIVKSFF